MNRERRRILQTAGLVLAGAVAGCSGGGDDATDTEADATDTEADATDTEADATDTEMSGTTNAESTATGTATDSSTVDFTLNNVGASAWEVTAGGEAVSATGENPTLSLEVGTRYVVQNDGWSAHPLAFRAADDSPLLSQSADGSYETDGAVDWVDDDTSVAFTVTADLAADLDYYICTVHSSMRGSVETA